MGVSEIMTSLSTVFCSDEIITLVMAAPERLYTVSKV